MKYDMKQPVRSLKGKPLDGADIGSQIAYILQQPPRAHHPHEVIMERFYIAGRIETAEAEVILKAHEVVHIMDALREHNANVLLYGRADELLEQRGDDEADAA